MCHAMCGADCESCGFGKENHCRGCAQSKGKPFGKPCFIYNYIQTGGKQEYQTFKKQLVNELNALGIPGLPIIEELYAINGCYVNVAYPMPNGTCMKLLDDQSIYLCNQVESAFNDSEHIRCFGIVCGMDFLLVAEYGANCSDPQLVLWKKR